MFFVKIDDKFIDEVLKPAMNNLENQIAKLSKYHDSLGTSTASIEPSHKLLSLSAYLKTLKSQLSLYHRFGEALMSDAGINTMKNYLDYDVTTEIDFWSQHGS